MGTVIQLKNQINNSYFQLKDSVEDKLLLVEEKIKLKLSSDVDLVEKMTAYHLDTGGKRFLFQLFFHGPGSYFLDRSGWADIGYSKNESCKFIHGKQCFGHIRVARHATIGGMTHDGPTYRFRIALLFQYFIAFVWMLFHSRVHFIIKIV